MNPTPRQQALLDATLAVLEPDERILAAWLGGSFGQGSADEWSDVDVHTCVADDDLVAVEADIDRIRSAIMTPCSPPSSAPLPGASSASGSSTTSGTTST